MKNLQSIEDSSSTPFISILSNGSSKYLTASTDLDNPTQLLASDFLIYVLDSTNLTQQSIDSLTSILTFLSKQSLIELPKIIILLHKYDLPFEPEQPNSNQLIPKIQSIYQPFINNLDILLYTTSIYTNSIQIIMSKLITSDTNSNILPQKIHLIGLLKVFKLKYKIDELGLVDVEKRIVIAYSGIESTQDLPYDKLFAIIDLFYDLNIISSTSTNQLTVQLIEDENRYWYCIYIFKSLCLIYKSDGELSESNLQSFKNYLLQMITGIQIEFSLITLV